MRRATIAVLALLATPLAAQQPAGVRDTVRTDTVGGPLSADTLTRSGDTVVTPTPNQALGVDAEVRAALFELAEDRYLQALGRLEWLQESPEAVPAAPPGGAVRGRQDMLFLLAESYYRLGMSEPFRAAAQALLGSPGAARYEALVRPQLLLDAYRRGEYERATRLADSVALAQVPAETRGLAALVAGLSAYQLRRYPEARSAFASARQAGPAYAGPAGYMDVLTQLRADTAQIAPALTALQALATEASGAFADQIRLTAAQLAYEAEQYPEAVRIAGAIPASSGLAAQALLTRAWALYKADQIEAAGEAFLEFGRRFPQMPEREESLLMAAQALLQLGRTDEAAQLFRTVADSASAGAGALRAGATGVARTASALVNSRAAGLLFITDPASGKTIALEDAAGAEWAVLAAVFADTILPSPRVALGGIVSLDEVLARLDSATRAGDAALPESPARDVTRRVFFTQASATATRGEYVSRSQELYAADLAVALARCRLEEATAALALRITMLEQLRARLDDEARVFDQTAATLALTQDSLARLNSVLDAAAMRLRQMFEAQTRVTRLLAAENTSMIDSLRSAMTGSLGENEHVVLNYEAQTAQIYGQIASSIEGELDRAIRHHPVFALRDSVSARGDSLRQLLSGTRQVVASVRQSIDDELNSLRAGEPERIRMLRSTLASAEARQANVEAQMVALVNAELEARAGELLADLQRGVEAAEFGSASAAFFQALDAGRATTTPARSGVTGAAGSGATGGARTGSAALPPSQQK